MRGASDYEMRFLGRWSGTAGAAATAGEVYDAVLEHNRALTQAAHDWDAREAAYDARITAIAATMGVTLDNPVRARVADGFAGRTWDRLTATEDPFSRFDRRLRELAAAHPDLAGVIRPDEPPDLAMRQRAAAAERRQADVLARRGGSLWTDPAAVAAMVGGGVRGAVEDPVQVLGMLVGPVSPVGLGARAIGWAAVKTGLANAGVEAVMAPDLQEWRKLAGLEHGWREAAGDVGGAFAMGAAFDAAGRSLFRGVRSHVQGRTPELDEAGRVRRWQRPEAAPATPAAPAAPAPPASRAAAEDALEAAARSAPPDGTVRRAADGDADAIAQLARDTGADADPAVRGAVAEARLDAEIEPAHRPPALVPEAEHIDRIAQALRSAAVDGEPPPGAATPVAAADALRAGRPVPEERVRLADLGADPERLQFRAGAAADGTTGRLADVGRIDPEAVGRVVVFEPREGPRLVADGHERVALARRADAAAEAPATILREADGWTAADARAFAARENFKSSQVDPLDAARLMRARPDAVDASVPLDDPAMSMARGLARLSDQAFAGVEAGGRRDIAALVGAQVEDPTHHARLIDEVAAAEPRTLAEARAALAEARARPTPEDAHATMLAVPEHARRTAGPLDRGGIDDPAGPAVRAAVDAAEAEGGGVPASARRRVERLAHLKEATEACKL